jgi:hypothetical protein
MIHALFSPLSNSYSEGSRFFPSCSYGRSRVFALLPFESLEIFLLVAWGSRESKKTLNQFHNVAKFMQKRQGRKVALIE